MKQSSKVTVLRAAQWPLLRLVWLFLWPSQPLGLVLRCKLKIIISVYFFEVFIVSTISKHLNVGDKFAFYKYTKLITNPEPSTRL